MLWRRRRLTHGRFASTRLRSLELVPRGGRERGGGGDRRAPVLFSLRCLFAACAPSKKRVCLLLLLLLALFPLPPSHTVHTHSGGKDQFDLKPASMRLLSVRPFAPSLLLLGGYFVTPLGCCRQRRATVHPLFPLFLLLVFVRIMYHQVVLDEEEEEGTIGISHTYYFCLFPPSRPCVGVGVLGTGDSFSFSLRALERVFWGLDWIFRRGWLLLDIQTTAVEVGRGRWEGCC